MQPVDMTRLGKPKFVELKLGELGKLNLIGGVIYSCMQGALQKDALIAALHLVLHGKD